MYEAKGREQWRYGDRYKLPNIWNEIEKGEDMAKKAGEDQKILNNAGM